MGAGRKTETVWVSEYPSVPSGGGGAAHTRNLSKHDLGGVIFGCKNFTMGECLSKQLFGLPSSHFSYVKNIEPGLTLFHFNYSDRKMHGIYEAASHGKMNIDPYAWTGSSIRKTDFPAQVNIRIRRQCQPITENQFKKVIGDNYYGQQHFWFELDHAQTEGLIALFLKKTSDLSTNVNYPSAAPRTANLSTTSEPTTCNLYANLGSESYGAAQPNGLDGLPLHKQNDEDTQNGNMGIMQIDNPSEETLVPSHSDGLSPYVPQHVNDRGIILENPVSLEKLNKSTPDLHNGNAELVQALRELKERVAALEKKQSESELKIQQLLDVARDSASEIHRLNDCVKTLESKIIQSVGSDKVIYLIGGFNGNSWLSALDSFSPSRDILMPLKPMSSVRAYASATVLDGNIFVFGGGDGSSWCNKVECYNQMNDSWTSCSPLLRDKGSLAGATLNGKIYAIGGGNGSESFSNIEMFDPAVGRWIYNHSMLQKRFALAAVQLYDVLYATGGFDGDNYLQTMEMMDHRVGYWTKLPDMKTQRGCHTMAVMNDKIYAMGGFDGNRMVSSVEIFDPRNHSWVEGEQLNFVRGYAAAAVLGGSLFVIGGVNDNNEIIETVECYGEGRGWFNCTHKAIGKRSFFSSVVL